jgi:hypothetical protein
MNRTIFAGLLAIFPLSAAAQSPAVWQMPPVCLKADGKTPESCQLRQCRALGINCYEPEARQQGSSLPHNAPSAQRKVYAVLPPAEYDKPFGGKLTEIRVGPGIMRAMCPKTQYDPTLACAYTTSDRSECVVIMVSDDLIRARGWTPEIVRRHEVGHCNGFPADHRGARPWNTVQQ